MLEYLKYQGHKVLHVTFFQVMFWPERLWLSPHPGQRAIAIFVWRTN